MRTLAFLLLLVIITAHSAFSQQDKPSNAFQVSVGIGIMDARDVNKAIAHTLQSTIMIEGSYKMLAAAFIGVHQSFYLNKLFYLQPEYQYSQGYKRFQPIGGGIEDWIVFQMHRHTLGLMAGMNPGNSNFYVEAGPSWSWLKYMDATGNTLGGKVSAGYTFSLGRAGLDSYISAELCNAQAKQTSAILGFNNIQTGVRLRLPFSRK